MKRITRAEARKHLEQLRLACELTKIIRHFFPDLVGMLSRVQDPRHKSYITYKSHILLMVRILASVFYISSMRKTSEEMNCSTAIENIGILCKEEDLKEMPHWSTINDFLERLEPEELEKIIPKLVKHLIRMRRFEKSRIRNKYWQIIVDGTQLSSEIDTECKDTQGLTRKHYNPDGSIRYVEYYNYVVEAKLVLANDIVISIATEFAENKGRNEKDKQDCELKAGYRLMDKLKGYFPHLPICLTVDSLYAGEPLFTKCIELGWQYIVRFKEKKIPYITTEYQELSRYENHEITGWTKEGKKAWLCNYVAGIDYNGFLVNVVYYEEIGRGYPFIFLTNLPVTKKNQVDLAALGRRRWKIENQGFDIQKNHGYNLEHRFSKDYKAMKNHYYLIQIGHMISQMIERWKKLWENTRLSLEQKHKRLIESWKTERLKEYASEPPKSFQVRFG